MKFLKTYKESVESVEYVELSGFHNIWKDQELVDKIKSLEKYIRKYDCSDEDGDFLIEKPIKLSNIMYYNLTIFFESVGEWQLQLIYFSKKGKKQGGEDEVTETDGDLIYIPVEYGIDNDKSYNEFRNYFFEIDDVWFISNKLGLL